jgi:putative MATE family efflux protein
MKTFVGSSPLDISSAAPATMKPAPDSRQQIMMLSGPIAGTLLRFAAPTIVVVTVQALVSVMETYFVGFLGTDALAGVAVVFPVIMLMQMMSAGGMGGGIASAVARALGAGRKADADALVLHSVIIAVVLGLIFTLGILFWGSPLYRLLGGQGPALQAALTYSNIVFAGSVAVWLLNTFGAVLRGAGNMVLPARVSLFGAVLLVPLSALLIFGSGPFPGYGIAGAGYAFVLYYVAATVVLASYLISGRSPVTLRFRGVRLKGGHFADIFSVGAVSALMTVQANVIVIVVTGIVGTFGTAALAGYGLATRLDYLLIPLLFGLGSAAVTLVGTNMGAGQVERARKIAWTAVAIGAGATELIGLVAGIAPQLWISIFSDAPNVMSTGETYLRIVGPFYGCVGAAMIVYFSSQGAGRMLWPFVSGIVRLLLATVGSWMAVHQLGAGLAGLSWMIAASFIAFSLLSGLALRPGAWCIAALASQMDSRRRA